jgi:hypothetical protein
MSSEFRTKWNISAMAYFKVPGVFICGSTALSVAQAVSCHVM